MKKTILMLAVIMTVASSAVLANDERDVNAKVLSSFNKEFAAAKQVKWSHSGEYVTAAFVLNAHRVIALFDESGTLMGTARDILFTELPLKAALAINKEYKNAGIYGIIEVTNEEGVNYHMTIDTKKVTYQAKVSTYGEVYILSKEKK